MFCTFIITGKKKDVKAFRNQFEISKPDEVAELSFNKLLGYDDKIDDPYDADIVQLSDSRSSDDIARVHYSFQLMTSALTDLCGLPEKYPEVFFYYREEGEEPEEGKELEYTEDSELIRRELQMVETDRKIMKFKE